MPLFSTIIPAFNRQDLIAATLDSVFAQRCDDQEVIVVDDGSTDGTLEVVARYGARVQVLRQNNAGPGAARNLGIQHARGEYVAFLDSDDVWFPWTLETYRRILHEQGQPQFISGCLTDFSTEAELAAVQETPLRVQRWDDYLQAAVEGYYVGAGRAVVRTEVIKHIGGFTDRRINCEDHDLALRLGLAKGFVWVHDPPTIGRRRHPQSVSLDMRYTYPGIRYLVEQENAGCYPGDAARRNQRQEIIALHARTASFNCLRYRAAGLGWRIYWHTWRWQWRLRRWRYLLGFPIMGVKTLLRAGR